MTKPDFAELKEKLTEIDYVAANAYLTRYMEGGYVEPTYQQYGDYIHGKSAAIISELIEIIKSQSDVIKDFYKTAQRIDKFGYGVNIESKGIISNTEDILVQTCANAIEVITETNTRLQKLREGK